MNIYDNTSMSSENYWNNEANNYPKILEILEKIILYDEVLNGHFATSIVLHKVYPDVLPFILTVGVGLLDLTFGVLAYYGLETITDNPKAGLISVDLHCPYSHSLIGSFIISSIYGLLSGGSFLPAFLSSFSHFAEDWIVHNKDLFLDPYSNILVGGTTLWSHFPIFTYYLEALFCVGCALFTSKDIFSIIANVPSAAGGLAKVANLQDDIKQEVLLKTFLNNFGVPAIIIGFLLFKNYYGYRLKLKKN
ncbi:hypothetical protein BJ944DRAFT_292229 [Cunninghamella echinulata]|nr:hypothetical protein BJ944DRAFT_292229 [Cunninghamella echinulata]